MSDDIQSKAADLVKKILTVGVGAVFLTEESLRALVSEFKLPKELLTGLLDTAGKTKNEFLQKVSSDVIARITERVEAKALLEEILQKHHVDFDIKMSVNFRKKDEK